MGNRVTGWKEGDRVVSETAAIINANSPLSRTGLYNLDPDRKGFGYGVNGAMTKYVRVPARCLHRVPDQLPFEHACLTEPCCVAYNAVVGNSHIKPGDRVIVLGPGTIGILCAAVARLCGAEVAIVGLESDKHRLDIAKQYGCEAIIGDATEWAKKRDGLGADFIIDAAGASITLKMALQLVRPNGHITKVWLGPAAAGLFIGSTGSKECYASRKLQSQLAYLGKSDLIACKRNIGCETIIGGVWPITEWQ